MIMVYKMLNGLVHCNTNKIVPLKDNNSLQTRSHNVQLLGSNECKTMKRKNYFSQRVVSHWNSLNSEIVASDSVNEFKGRYDKAVLSGYVS